MPFRARPFVIVQALLLAAPLLATGCSSTDCTSDFRPAFAVHVTDQKSGADIAFADLTFDHTFADLGTSTASTDENGLFNSPYRVEAGQWSVVVAKSGYRSQKQYFVVDENRCQNRGPSLQIALSLAP